MLNLIINFSTILKIKKRVDKKSTLNTTQIQYMKTNF